MVASVPIPFLSISPIKSDSDIGSGGVVWPGDGDVDEDEDGSGDDIGDIGNIDIGDGDNNDGDNSDCDSSDGAEDINGVVIVVIAVVVEMTFWWHLLRWWEWYWRCQE